jgi:hypothetical protein
MTQWSTYTPYDTSYMPSDVDQVDSTRLKAARVLSVVVIAVSALLMAGPVTLAGLSLLASAVADALAI